MTTALLCGMLPVCAGRASAAGTPAGTVITARASAVYKFETSPGYDSSFSNTVSMSVGQAAALGITPASRTRQSNGDGVASDFAFTLTNTGNGSDAFTLTVVSSRAFDARVYRDADGSGTLDPAELAAGAVAQTPTLAADSSFAGILRVIVPKDPSLNGQADIGVVTAASVFNGTKQAAFTATTNVNTAVFDLSHSLTALPALPAGGEEVLYTFTITNTGSLEATDVTFSDIITAPYAYATGTGTNFTPPGAGNTAVWNAGTIAPGATVTVTLTLTVAPGTPGGVVLNNTVGVVYATPGGILHELTSNTPFVTVGASSGVSMTPAAFSMDAEMEDSVMLQLAIRNTGNRKDVFEMAFASSNGFTVLFRTDANANGILDGADRWLTDTNAKDGADTDSLAAGASVTVTAIVVVPTGITTDRLNERSSITVSASSDASATQTSTAAVTVNIPNVVVTRTVWPGATSVPGGVNTYTTSYRNTGHGRAFNVRIVEAEPENSSYVPNSTTVDGTPHTDAPDADGVTVTETNGRRMITVELGTLPGLSPPAPGTVRFNAVVR